MYVVLLMSMRVMGKRMGAQLGIGELTVVLMLGAAISAPIQPCDINGCLPPSVFMPFIFNGSAFFQRSRPHAARLRRIVSLLVPPPSCADELIVDVSVRLGKVQ